MKYVHQLGLLIRKTGGGKEILVFHFTHYLFDLYLVLVSGYFLRVHVGFFFIYRRLLGQ